MLNEVYRNIRGPFWDSGRHIINIKIITFTDGIGIGIIDKSYNISANQYQYHLLDQKNIHESGEIFHNGSQKNKLVHIKQEILLLLMLI